MEIFWTESRALKFNAVIAKKFLSRKIWKKALTAGYTRTLY